MSCFAPLNYPRSKLEFKTCIIHSHSKLLIPAMRLGYNEAECLWKTSEFCSLPAGINNSC